MTDLLITIGVSVLCVAGVLIGLHVLDRRDEKRYWFPTKTPRPNVKGVRVRLIKP